MAVDEVTCTTIDGHTSYHISVVYIIYDITKIYSSVYYKDGLQRRELITQISIDIFAYFSNECGYCEPVMQSKKADTAMNELIRTAMRSPTETVARTTIAVINTRTTAGSLSYFSNSCIYSAELGGILD